MAADAHPLLAEFIRLLGSEQLRIEKDALPDVAKRALFLGEIIRAPGAYAWQE
jgi:hypothetical protein